MSSKPSSDHISVDLASVASIATTNEKEKPAGVIDVDRDIKNAQEKALERARSLNGRVISDRYRIVDLIAMGGMGAVYVAEHMLMHKRIAVKILHPESEDHPEIVARFEREALVGAHIDHPNIAHATDFGKLDDGSYFLILEHVEGKNLADIIRGGPLEPKLVVRIARQIAAGLSAAHALGIVHRDLKPRNVMLDRSITAKLIDFGFAKVSVGKLPLTVSKEARPQSRLTGVGVIFGTINYLAPEAAHGMDSVDERADIYALGIIVYELLTGKHPFDTTDPVEMFSHHRATPPPSFKTRAPDLEIPPELEAIVQKMLEKDPFERLESATAVIQAFDALPFPDEPDDESPAFLQKTPPPPSVTKSRKDDDTDIASGKPEKGAASRKKTSKKKKSRRDGPAKAAPAKQPAAKATSLTYLFALIAIVAVGAAAFFATR